jgi:hypothetical protein
LLLRGLAGFVGTQTAGNDELLMNIKTGAVSMDGLH